MAEIPFYLTGYGRKFLEGDLPRLIAALEAIAAELKRANDTRQPTKEMTTHGD